MICKGRKNFILETSFAAILTVSTVGEKPKFYPAICGICLFFVPNFIWLNKKFKV